MNNEQNKPQEADNVSDAQSSEWNHENSGLIQHAKRELKVIGYIPLDQEQEDGPNKWVQKSVLELLTTFAKQGHSGSSAPYVIGLFAALAAYKPLAPLTGADDEWVEVGTGMFQNNRCSHVFKQADRFNGQPYDLNGRVFREPNGVMYTNSMSMKPITFPYTPTTEIVDVSTTSPEVQ